MKKLYYFYIGFKTCLKVMPYLSKISKIKDLLFEFILNGKSFTNEENLKELIENILNIAFEGEEE